MLRYLFVLISFCSFAYAHDSVDSLVKVVMSIDASKSKNPDNTTKLQKLVSDFAKCIKDKSIDPTKAGKIICGATLASQIQKLQLEISDINEASFKQIIKDRAFSNLAESYAYMAKQIKDIHIKSDLCDTLSSDLNKNLNGASACDSRQTEVAKNQFKKYASKSSDQISLSNLKNELIKSMREYKDATLEAAQCDELDKQLAQDSNNPKLLAKKHEIELIAAQARAAQSLHRVEMNHDFLFTILAANPNLKSDIEEDIGREQSETMTHDPFGKGDQVKQALAVERDRIIVQAGELAGHGTDIKHIRMREFDEPGQLNPDSLEFLIAKYPSLVGQTLYENPHMLSSVCDSLTKIGTESDTQPYVWGDKVKGPKVIAEIGAGTKATLITGTVIANTANKDYSLALSVAGKTCDTISESYKAKNKTASQRDLIAKESQLANALRRAQQKMPTVNANLEWFKTGLGLQKSCNNENYSSYKIEMMDHAIETLDQVSNREDFAKLLNDTTKKMYLSGDKFASDKTLLLIAKLATLPENKIGDMVTQDKLINKLSKDFKDGNLDFLNSLRACCKAL